MTMPVRYSREECRNFGGHFAVGGLHGRCARCGIELAGPGLHEAVDRLGADPHFPNRIVRVQPDPDRATSVTTFDAVPDPLYRYR